MTMRFILCVDAKKRHCMAGGMPPPTMLNDCPAWTEEPTIRLCQTPLPGRHPRVASLALRAIHLRVAPKGSGEECGWKSEGQQNLQACAHAGRRRERRWRSGNVQNRYIAARIPLQSPIGSEEPIGDSFSPGEAMGCSRTRAVAKMTVGDGSLCFCFTVD